MYADAAIERLGFTAAAWLLRSTLLDVLASQPRLQQAKWLMDNTMAYHLILTIDTLMMFCI